MFKNFDELIGMVKGQPNRVVVPGANSEEALSAIKMADENGLISSGILIGDIPTVKAMMKNVGLSEEKFEFIQCTDVAEMCQIAARQVKEGKADFFVKGLVDTKYYMKAILNKEMGFVPAGALLTHFVIFTTTKYHKPFAVTDSAIMIAPTLEQKVGIINNAVAILHKLGVENPKVAMVCPVEKVNDKIPSTLDAQAIVQMNKEGKIPGCVIEGPYDLYIALSKHAAEEKGIKDAVVAGDADLLVFPDLDAGNPMYKAIAFFGENAQGAAMIAGPNVPAILPSRADAPRMKLNSIALCSLLKNKK